MDLSDPSVRAVFFDVHKGLPREGPGDRASTARALALAGPPLPGARVLDVACGPGMQTMDLADLLPDARIRAIDSHEPFVRETNRRARARGVAQRVRAELGDMRALALPPAGLDLIWCEGAAYIMGVGPALRSWRPLLKAHGRLALSEAVWLRPDPPEPVRRLWSGYPAMGDLEACRSLVRNCGYRLLGDFVLPERAWWEHYYTPMERRLAELAPRYAGHAVAEAVLRQHQDEIALYRRYAAGYGYAFLALAVDA